MSLVTITGTAPAHWASYLINGDNSALDANEEGEANEFIEYMGGRIVSCDDAEFFAYRCDASRVMFDPKGAMCLTYTALVERADS